jgi:hexosaminidase
MITTNFMNHLFASAQSKRELMLLFFVIPLFCFSQPSNVSVSSSVNNIIPKPVSIQLLESKPLELSNYTVIVSDKKFSEQAEYLQQQIKIQCGLDLSIKKTPSKKTPAIVLEYTNKTVDRPEMYLLDIKNNQVKIQGQDVQGIVHGIQTLLQLLPLKPTENILLPSVSIEDYPRFLYRGMHLDVSRHFFPASFVKKYIDYLAFHKFNTFHWHLTDDQGWRIEIKAYPKLTEVGAWRDSTLIGHTRATPVRFDGVRYGGYYTQNEVKDIIHYAAIRGITIIPEVDIPGHSRAAIASYPELSTNPDSTWQVATVWAMFNRHNNVLAPNEKTFAFLRTVFGEIADLFPSPYIHIGGDECSKTWWKADPKTQAFMKQHGLKDETELQTYFIQQVIGYLKAKGKKVIGWDEILEPGLDTSAIIMNWRGVKAAITAAENGHEVIMVPGKPLYFDFYQSNQKDSLAIGGYNPLDSVYLFEPVPAQIAAKGLTNQVMGAQANVWTEYMAYPGRVEYMVFPRMTALSEVLWTEKNKKDITDFKRRLELTGVPRYRFWNSSYYEDLATTAVR